MKKLGFWIFGLIATVAVVAGPVMAAKGRKPSTGGASLAVVVLTDSDGDGLPSRDDTITFKITQSITDKPYVELICTQNGATVYDMVAGYFEGYLWPWNQNMLLKSDIWQAGSASCIADLYYNRDLRRVSMTKLNFTAGE